LPKYQQNLDNFKDKNYIHNLNTVFKLFNFGNESKEMRLISPSDIQFLNERKKVGLVYVSSLKWSLVSYKAEDKLLYPDEMKNSVHMCINCISKYTINYLSELVVVYDYNSKSKNYYLINNLSLPLFINKWDKFKKFLPLPFSQGVPVVKKVDYSIVPYLNILSDDLVINLPNLQVLHERDKVKKKDKPVYFNLLNEQSTSNEVGGKWVWMGKLFIKLFKKVKFLSFLLLYKKHKLDASGFLVRKEKYSQGPKTSLNKIIIINNNNRETTQVLKLKSEKYKLLINYKYISLLCLSEEKKKWLLNEFRVHKTIIEGKLWDILNLYLTHNDLSFSVLYSLKKQAIRDFNLANDYDVNPELLSYYGDKINNITYHSIFKILENEWYDVKWIISFKFDTVFLNEHKNMLIEIIKDNIKLENFEKLINILLDMKLIDIDNYKSISRFNISENDKLSQFLINIFFCKLDKTVNNFKNKFFDKYSNLFWIKYWNLKLNSPYGNVVHPRNGNVITKTKFNFKYIRYLDTFIIGINGTKSDVKEIRTDIVSFLKTELQLKSLYSSIIDIQNDNFKFMNIIVSNALYYDNKYKILFLSPKRLIIKALINTGILNSSVIPIYMKNILNLNLNNIINIYIDIYNFILSSFSHCHDFFSLSKLISYYINYSLKLTVQVKFRKKSGESVIRHITPINHFIKNSKKTASINNSYKLTQQRSIEFLKKRPKKPFFNIMVLFRLGLISIKTFKKLYYFKVSNKKYLKRKFVNRNIVYNNNNINWESNVNFDFLISKYIDYSTTYKSKSIFNYNLAVFKTPRYY
jgi:hypothetical protein